jgi:hypothetical protein
MSRRAPALAAAAVAAALVAATPAFGYVRSADEESGACFYWGPRQVPYVINAPDEAALDGLLQPACSVDAALAAVRAGFAEWPSQSCTDLALVETPAGSTSRQVGYVQGAANENLVVFRRSWCKNVVPAGHACLTATAPDQSCDTVFNCFDDRLLSRSTIALTTVTYSPSSGQIFDADLEINAWGGASGSVNSATGPSDGWYFSCLSPLARSLCSSYGQDGCDAMDLQNTVTHEAGHFIGLAHPCEVGEAGNECVQADVPTTMYPRAMMGEYEKRSLDPDDRTGVCDVYPAGAATLRCTAGDGDDGSSGCGCGTTTPAGAIATLLGLAALAPRLRGRRRAASRDTTAREAAQDTTTPA